MAGEANDEPDLDAGEFSPWLEEMRAALRGERDADVPCDGCTACCTSSQFVHISPDETDTLAHVPPELLFPAPRLPRGHVLLGYDERGHCPMLVDGACSIYEHRPRTCRTYDCRIFPATGVAVGGDDKVLIGRRTQRWKFAVATRTDRTRRDAVRAAAAFLSDRTDMLPAGTRPTNPTQLAVLAVEMHDVFLRHDDETGEATVFEPSPEFVLSELERRMPRDSA